VSGRQLDLLFLSADDIREAELSADDVLEVVEQGLRAHGLGEVVMPPKDHLSVEEQFEGHFNILKAYVPAFGFAGVKVIGDYVNNYRHDLPSELALLTLYRAETGTPVAIMDATELTWMRTGAVTAIGAKHLARPGSRVLGHIGARGTARYNLRYLAGLFDLEQIRVTSRRPESRAAFARAMSEELGREVVAVDTPAEAIAGAQIIVDASRLTEPAVLVPTAAVEPGALVVPYGAVMSTEADLPATADKFVVDDWEQAARGQFGQYTETIRAGALRREHLHAEIGEIVTGRKPGRERPDERIVFWHRGFAVSDVMLGNLIYERAVAAGLGTRLVLQSAAYEP
jgi:ornithine cyclodeaminase